MALSYEQVARMGGSGWGFMSPTIAPPDQYGRMRGKLNIRYVRNKS